MTNPFDYVNSILSNKKYLIVDKQTEKDYNPFLTNRALSYNMDTVLYAQEMNVHNELDKKLQYDYYINIIRPAKRTFTKWVKRKDDDKIAIIQEYFGFSYQKAQVALSILSSEQINEIKKKLDKGGIK